MDYFRRIINNHHADGTWVCHHQTTMTRSRTRLRRDDDAQEEETQPHVTTTTNQTKNVFATSSITTATEKLAFLPDFTEHPKPKRRPRQPTKPTAGGAGGGAGAASGGDKDGDKTPTPPTTPPVQPEIAGGDSADEEEITFFHDFVSGGVAGCASVIVGHPFDTMKVRMQTSSGTGGLLQTFREFGGFSTIFRGMAAPLGAATAINAVVFGSYGFSSRLYDQNFGTTTYDDDENIPTHDPWQKSMTCGSFAGATQCLIICPMEHIKCRLQTQSSVGAFRGPVDATRRIVTEHGWQRLYQGWWSTALREIPAFGLYFASYDHLKDRANTFLLNRERQKLLLQGQSGTADTAVLTNTHTWLASAFAGGCAGSITWAIVYPVDVIKSQIQTAPLDTPFRDLRMLTVGKAIVARHGYRYLFRGLGITLIRAFPVNGTIFPVYEFTLKQVTNWGV